MARLTSKQRHGLDTASFALPGRRYPIPDASHARNALSRASANASPAQQATIKRKVKARFPAIEVGGKPKAYADGGKVGKGGETPGYLKPKKSEADFREQERDMSQSGGINRSPATIGIGVRG
jgi:hypothetical protein